MPTKVVIVGGGFAGLNAAKTLGHRRDVHVTVIDRRNHHLFQPLLYQVATAGLSPADISLSRLCEWASSLQKLMPIETLELTSWISPHL